MSEAGAYSAVRRAPRMREGADCSVRTLSAGGRQVNGIQGRKAEPHSGFGPLAACAGRARALLLLRSLWAGFVRDGSWSVGSCSVASPPALTAAALRSNARIRLRRGLAARAALDGGGSASPGCGGVGRGWPAGGAAGDGSGLAAPGRLDERIFETHFANLSLASRASDDINVASVAHAVAVETRATTKPPMPPWASCPPGQRAHGRWAVQGASLDAHLADMNLDVLDARRTAH
eukprot:s829_g28.t1